MAEPVRHRQTKGAETDMFEPKATASHLDSTSFDRTGLSAPCPILPPDRDPKSRYQACRFPEPTPLAALRRRTTSFCPGRGFRSSVNCCPVKNNLCEFPIGTVLFRRFIEPCDCLAPVEPDHTFLCL
jgi:hypothetical protein